MAFGIKIYNTSGSVKFDSTSTTALLKEHIEETSATSGSATYTDATGETAYAITVAQGVGGPEGFWTDLDFNVSTGADANNNPTVSYNIVCTNIAPAVFSECGNWVKYHIFVFTR